MKNKINKSEISELSKEILEKYYIKEKRSNNTLKTKLKKFTSLLDVSAVLTSTLDLERVLDIIMSESREVIGAEASSLLLIDQKTNELVFYIAQGEKGEAVKEIRLKMGQGIAGWVAQSGESVLVKDAAKDPRFFKDADAKTKFQTKSLMAVPLKGRRGVVGVVEVLNKIGGGAFTKTDLRILEAFAIHAGIAIENARLYQMAITDSMTKLYIKRFFYFRLEEEIARSKRYEKPLSIVMIDIDFFKKVNDTYGHQAGDKVILELANILRNMCRKVDIPCRFGGEEMAIIAPETDKQGILTFGERIRKAVEDSEIVCNDQTIKITVSIGCAVLSKKIKNMEDFVEMADLALYYGKENGRNAVTLYNSKKMKKIDLN